MATPGGLLARILGERRHAVGLVAVAALAIVASLPYGALYGRWTYLVPVGGMCAIALAVSLLGRALRQPWWASAIALVALGTLYVGEVVYPGKTLSGLPKPAMFAAVWRGVTGSWSALLGAGLPADPRGDIVVLPIAVAALVTFVAAELVLRRPWTVPPVVPAVVAYGAALAFAGRTRHASIGQAIGLAALVLVVLYHRANASFATGDVTTTTSRRRAPTRTAGVVLAIIAAGAAIGWSIPVFTRAAPFALRDHYAKPIELRDSVTPLASIAARADQAPGDTMFTVSFTGVPDTATIDRVPFAILDTYDGAAWGTSSTFDRAGRRLPVRDAVERPVASARVQQRYTLKSWWTSFLPALERPVAVTDGAQLLAVDPVTGSLTTSADAPADLSYTIASDYPTTSDPQLTDAKVPSGVGALAPWTATPPDVPDAFRQFVVSLNATHPDARAVDKLRTIAAALQTTPFAYSSKALPGHSLGRLTQLVAPDPATTVTAAAHLGSTEQYAAAFALAARLLGIPSRVVVGYRVDAAAARQGVEIAVVGRDLIAWPEVLVQGHGWVAFDATAQATRDPDATAPPPTPPAVLPTSAIDAQVKGQQACDTGGCLTAEVVKGHGAWPAWSWALLVPALLVALLVACAVGRIVLRRRRRASSDPSARIVGAWKESADWITGCGLATRGPSLTPTEVSAALLDRSPELARRVEELAPLLDVALYAPDRPTVAQADESWVIERALRREAGRMVPIGARVRASLDPRPLVRRRPQLVEVRHELELV